LKFNPEEKSYVPHEGIERHGTLFKKKYGVENRFWFHLEILKAIP
jgi:hypothetical protein